MTEIVKYLGIRVNNKLKWNSHIEDTVYKGSRILGLLRYTLIDAPTKVKLVYFALCRPVLKYGSAVWDPYENEQTNKLEVLQNKALCFIFNIKCRVVRNP